MHTGEPFPHFVLKDENGETVDSKDLRGIRHAVFFFPEDGVSVAGEYGGQYPKFMLRNILVFGIGSGSPEAHRKMKDSGNLRIKLLSDPGGAFMRETGASAEGNTYSAFLVGRDGNIEEMWIGIQSEGHVRKVLDAALAHFRNDGPLGL